MTWKKKKPKWYSKHNIHMRWKLYHCYVPQPYISSAIPWEMQRHSCDPKKNILFRSKILFQRCSAMFTQRVKTNNVHFLEKIKQMLILMQFFLTRHNLLCKQNSHSTNTIPNRSRLYHRITNCRIHIIKFMIALLLFCNQKHLLNVISKNEEKIISLMINFVQFWAVFVQRFGKSHVSKWANCTQNYDYDEF